MRCVTRHEGVRMFAFTALAVAAIHCEPCAAFVEPDWDSLTYVTRTMKADGVTKSSLYYNDTGYWSDGSTPKAGKHYLVPAGTKVTGSNQAEWSSTYKNWFRGDSLSVAGALNINSSTTNFKMLRLMDGGCATNISSGPIGGTAVVSSVSAPFTFTYRKANGTASEVFGDLKLYGAPETLLAFEMRHCDFGGVDCSQYYGNMTLRMNAEYGCSTNVFSGIGTMAGSLTVESGVVLSLTNANEEISVSSLTLAAGSELRFGIGAARNEMPMLKIVDELNVSARVKVSCEIRLPPSQKDYFYLPLLSAPSGTHLDEGDYELSCSDSSARLEVLTDGGVDILYLVLETVEPDWDSLTYVTRTAKADSVTKSSLYYDDADYWSDESTPKVGKHYLAPAGTKVSGSNQSVWSTTYKNWFRGDSISVAGALNINSSTANFKMLRLMDGGCATNIAGGAIGGTAVVSSVSAPFTFVYRKANGTASEVFRDLKLCGAPETRLAFEMRHCDFGGVDCSQYYGNMTLRMNAEYGCSTNVFSGIGTMAGSLTVESGVVLSLTNANEEISVSSLTLKDDSSLVISVDTNTMRAASIDVRKVLSTSGTVAVNCAYRHPVIRKDAVVPLLVGPRGTRLDPQQFRLVHPQAEDSLSIFTNPETDRDTVALTIGREKRGLVILFK